MPLECKLQPSTSQRCKSWRRLLCLLKTLKDQGPSISAPHAAGCREDLAPTRPPAKELDAVPPCQPLPRRLTGQSKHHTMQIYNKKQSRGQTQCPPGGSKCGDKTFPPPPLRSSSSFLEGRRNVSWLLTMKYSTGKGEGEGLGTGFSRYRSLCTLKWILTFDNLASSQRAGSGKTV